jgi:NAD(P) transhydrogenase subunit alpha
MNPDTLAAQALAIAQQAQMLALQLHQGALAAAAPVAPLVQGHAFAVQPFVFLLAIFVMACFVGYYVVWNVTPALHSPLMAVTNAISSVIVVGAMLAAGFAFTGASAAFGFLAVLLASVNIFGGFTVTWRMLSMFKAKGQVARK